VEKTGTADGQAEALQPVVREKGDMAKTMRTVEYFRCWAGGSGDHGTWDTDYIDIPTGTPDDKVQEAIEQACAKIEWRDGERPVLVGLYCDTPDEGEDEEGDEDFDEHEPPEAAGGTGP
jgi:hypothetical protein